jgi:hypothetical protein
VELRAVRLSAGRLRIVGLPAASAGQFNMAAARGLAQWHALMGHTLRAQVAGICHASESPIGVATPFRADAFSPLVNI